MTVEERTKELQSLTWHKQKSLAESLGLEKPDDISWDAFCESIAIEEYKRVESDVIEMASELIPEQLVEVIESATVEPATIEEAKTVVCELPTLQPKGLYATEYYKKNGIKHCTVCGEKYLYGLYGEPVCPESFASCPRLSNTDVAHPE